MELRSEFGDILNSGSEWALSDMSAVDFIDSRGLFLLVRTMKGVHLKRGDIAMLNVSARVRSTLEINRLNEIIEIFSDESLACAV